MPVIIAIAVSSNLQGARPRWWRYHIHSAGRLCRHEFSLIFRVPRQARDFWWYRWVPWHPAYVLLYYFRNLRQPVESGERTQVTDTVPTLLLVSTVTLLIIVSFAGKNAVTNGVICAAGGRGLPAQSGSASVAGPLGQFFRELDGQTLLLLASLFVIIAGITRAGVIDAIQPPVCQHRGRRPVCHLFAQRMGFGAFLRIY